MQTGEDAVDYGGGLMKTHGDILTRGAADRKDGNYGFILLTPVGKCTAGSAWL